MTWRNILSPLVLAIKLPMVIIDPSAGRWSSKKRKARSLKIRTEGDTPPPKCSWLWDEVAQWQTRALRSYLWFDSRPHHLSQLQEATMPRNKQKNLARAVAHRAQKSKDVRLGRSIEAALTGCSDRVLKAVNCTE